jgi:ABC-type Zn uptake system ZnuABC Zn-binding protein ZnuA
VGFKLFAVVAVVFVVLAAGCGGSKKKSASPPPTTTFTSTSTSTSAAPRFATSKNCAQLEALGTKLAQALQTTSGSAETRLNKEAQLLHDYANAAPSDVRGDFQTLADAFDTYAHALLKAGIKAGQAPTPAQIAKIQAAAKAFSTQKLRAAEQHLAAWAQKNCGATPTTTG